MSFLNFDSLHVENWTRWEINEARPEKIFWFEKIDPDFWYSFQTEKWWIFWVLTAAYWVGIFGLQRFMKNRTPWTNLMPIIVIYDIGVALFSIVAIYRFAPAVLHQLFSISGGLHKSLCYRTKITIKEQFWVLLFVWSKVFHFLDTVFDVLRKKPVQLTQMYHHSVVALFINHVFLYGEPFIFVTGLVNVIQHAITYPFLTLKALKVKLPKAVSSAIVVIELVQMLFGLVAGLYTRHVTNSGEYCIRHPRSMAIYNFIFFTLIILVVNMALTHFKLKKDNTKEKHD